MLDIFQKRFALGGLVFEQPGQQQVNWRIRFRVAIPIDLPADRLRIYLNLVQSTGDALEKELNPGAEDRL